MGATPVRQTVARSEAGSAYGQEIFLTAATVTAAAAEAMKKANSAESVVRVARESPIARARCRSVSAISRSQARRSATAAAQTDGMLCGIMRLSTQLAVGRAGHPARPQSVAQRQRGVGGAGGAACAFVVLGLETLC
jgi:hypothetical protein